MAKPPVKLILDKLPKIKKALDGLSREDVLVGVPRNKTGRDEPGAMTNATLAYIHDNGSPVANIPARPFMVPGIEEVKGKIKEMFKRGAKIKDGETADINKTLTMVGMTAQASIRSKINEGIPPPLKLGTLKGRIRKRTAIKGAKVELAHRKAGGDATLTNAKPLVATGQLRNSINYVIRKR